MLETEKSRLLIHRIRHNVPSEELNEVISRDSTHEYKLFRGQGGCYHCAIAVFNSPAEANQAFENIARDLGKDSAGLPQKQVFLKPTSPSGPGLYFHVRKMVEDDSVEETSAGETKRSYPEEKKKESCKKQKREHVPEETEKKRQRRIKVTKDKII